MARQRFQSPPFPAHFSRLIEEAGASAYQWHDEAMAEWVDGTGIWHRIARAGQYVAATLLALTLAGLLIGRMEWLPALAGVGVGVGFVLSRFRTTPWVASVVGLLVSYDMTAGDPRAFAAILVTSIVGWALLRPRHRDLAFAIAAILLAGLTLFGSTLGVYPTLAFLAVLMVLLGAIWFSGVRSLPRPWARVDADDLRASPPSPPTRLPWLVRLVKSREVADAPDEVRRKKIGADGERRTAIILLALRRGRGTRIAHDVAIPGADSANADHVVLARSGLFVIDSKQYGRRDDPGIVTYDQGSRKIVHRTSRGSRSIEKSLRTAAWAVEGIGNLVGVQGRAVLAIHNAAVAKNLVVERNGIEVEIIPTWSLPSRIDQSQNVLSWSQLAAATMSMYRLKSSTTGRSPLITSPRGATSAATQAMRGLDSEATASEAPRPAATHRPYAPPRAQGGHRTRPTPTPSPAPRSAARPQREEKPTPAVPVATAAPASQQPRSAQGTQSSRATEPVLSAQDRVADRWEQMRLSEPAPLDEVEESLRGLRRGTEIVLIEFSANDVQSRDMVAMTGVCGSIEGNYIWYCTPEQYHIHRTSGRKVNVSTVSTGKVMVKSEGVS